MNNEEKVKCKLLKVSSKWGYGYDDEQCIIEDISEFEELSRDDYETLKRWVAERKNNYVLIEPANQHRIRTAIKDQIAAEEELTRLMEIKRLEKQKIDEEKRRLREEKKIEQAKKKLEKLNKLVRQHENSISNDQKS